MFSSAMRSRLLIYLVFSGMSTFAHAQVPTAPSNCIAWAASATASKATIGIRWNDNSTNETQWKIQYSVNNGSYSDLDTVPSSTTASTGTTGVTWTTANLSTVYRFRIRAGNGSGFSAVSNVATVGTYDLNAPSNLSVTVVDPFNVTMRWEESSYGESGFAIERKTGTGPWVYLGTVSANTLDLSSINLVAPSLSYSFRIRAYKGTAPSTPDSPAGANVSPYSNVAPISTGSYPLTAAAVPGQSKINLSWSNIQNESGYQILILYPGAFSYEELTLVAANTTAYQATSPAIEAGKSYSFIVRPYAGSTIMGESSVASALTDAITSKTGTSSTPGTAFSHTFTVATSGSVTSRSLTDIPGGLTFNSSTGALTGVYPALGNYTLNFTANLSNGGVLTQTFYIRVRPPAGPPVVGTVIPSWTANPGATHDTALAGTFTDAEAESAVRVSTTLGDMDFILFDTATPATVANFMDYVNTGKYADVAFHRSVFGFVIQGGGFKGAGTGSDFTSVVTNPAVVNEPGIANEYGTVSMAKLGGDPNSATSQFFVSLGDNRANLDFQNGGFTVFGRVAGNGMTVAEDIGNLPTATYNLFLNGSPTATPFAGFPLNVPSMPAPMDQTNMVKMNSVASIPTISYSITGNTNPAVASAGIVGGQLRLVALAPGQTTVTLTATDLDNLTATQTVAVTINDTFTTWASRNSFPGGQSASGQNPDGDDWDNLQEYAFFGNPGVANPSAQTVFQGTAGTTPKFLTLTFPCANSPMGWSMRWKQMTDCPAHGRRFGNRRMDSPTRRS